MKRESEGSEPNCQKQSSQGERERERELTTPFEEKAKPRKQVQTEQNTVTVIKANTDVLPRNDNSSK